MTHPESVLHKYAKEVILESMGIMLPALPNSDNEGAWWTFEQVLPEFSLGLIRPDLVGYFDGEPLLIEIAVTHFIDAEKLKHIELFNSKCIEIDLSSLLKSDVAIPSIEAKKEILENLENRKWVYPFPLLENSEDRKNSISDESEETVTIQPNLENLQSAAKWQDYKFKIKGMHVNVRKFASGMISVNSTYNPEIIEMLRSWKKEGRGKYMSDYKSWNYWLPFSDTVLNRLNQMNEIK